MVSCGGSSGDAVTATAVAEDKPAEKAKEEEPEDVDLVGMFGDDDEYWALKALALANHQCANKETL